MEPVCCLTQHGIKRMSTDDEEACGADHDELNSSHAMKSMMGGAR